MSLNHVLGGFDKYGPLIDKSFSVLYKKVLLNILYKDYFSKLNS